MKKIYYRLYQSVLRLTSYILPWPKPILLKGENSILRLPKTIKEKELKNVLIVTDETIIKLKLINSLLEGLKEENINYFIYDKRVPNPTINNVNEAYDVYMNSKCEGIIAFGGGSPIDCAKGVGARVSKKGKAIDKMFGLLKIRKKMPPFFAVPTTTGTGSETTLAAVISSDESNQKNTITDPSLIPHFAVLDPSLTTGLPKHLTSTTGMDALTHAIEAFIGRSNTKETKRNSKKAIKLIYENILIAYNNPTNINARENMLDASYYAGLAFTRAYVGYIHSLAHAIGGLYNTPHGLANAVIMPYVLKYYDSKIYKQLAKLADLVEITNINDETKVKAIKFINSIEYLNNKMNIPKHLIEINEKDIKLIAKQAYKEANPFYPVPKILDKKDLETILYQVKGDN